MKKYIMVILLVIAISGCTPQVVTQQSHDSQTRTYYIAAEEVTWDYAPSGKNLLKNTPIDTEVWGEQTQYQKVRYVEYTDASFTQKKEQPEWLGILGPVIRAVEGDTINIVFWNMASEPYSIHPHGVFYNKDNEGAGYSGVMGKGAKIKPGEKYTYEWQVTEKADPGPAEGSSKIWMYHSHVDSVGDIYQGLVGPIIVTSKENAKIDGTPNDIDKEFVNLYLVFNEATDEMDEDEVEGHLMHAINGYIFGNLQGMEMNKGDRVRWHLLGLGTEVDLHTAHWHGETVMSNGKRTDVIELLPASMVSVDMVAENVGEWMYHCHVADHITAGMMTTYTINE